MFTWARPSAAGITNHQRRACVAANDDAVEWIAPEAGDEVRLSDRERVARSRTVAIVTLHSDVHNSGSVRFVIEVQLCRSRAGHQIAWQPGRQRQ